MPTSMIPSFPVPSAIFAGFFTTADYIIVTRRFRLARPPSSPRSRVHRSPFMPWFKKDSSEPLTVAMTGIKLGNRVLIVGVGDTALIAALGIKAGLTGRTCIVGTNEREVAQAAATVERDGALVESAVSPLTTLPYEAGSFDVVVLRDALGPARAEERPVIAAQAARVLRPGGRCLVIESSSKASLGGLVSRPINAEFHASGGATPLLTSVGFAAARTLAERSGLTFTEGVKRNA
jgi:threonine dehydrogenase-like Zn-dependent dehydrogenase